MTALIDDATQIETRRRHQQHVSALLEQIDERRRELYLRQAGGVRAAALHDLKAELRTLRAEMATTIAPRDALLVDERVRLDGRDPRERPASLGQARVGATELGLPGGLELVQDAQRDDGVLARSADHLSAIDIGFAVQPDLSDEG
jgi:hypothetical protein